MFCGEELIYSEEYKKETCIYCGKEFSTNVTCRNGHYVCDSCHALKGTDLILTYFRNTDKTNPLEMAIDIMKNSSFHMHGPEHHFLIPAALITSYCNITNEPKDKRLKMLITARKRAEDVKGGFCGFYGDCGAAVGTGIFVSIITSSTPLSTKSWGEANEVTGRSLIKIAETGGPRCCKRNLYTAIREAAEFVDRKFQVRLYDYETSKPVCQFSKFNSECLGQRCPYNKANNK